MSSILQPAKVFVSNRSWAFPLLLLMGAVAFSGFAFALRWDAASSVIGGLSLAGELEKTTDQDLVSKIATAQRVALVGGIAKGLLLMPLCALLLAVAVKFSAWLVGRSIAFVASLSAVVVALLPTSLYHLILGAVTLSSPGLSDAQHSRLIPSHLGHWLSGLSPQMERLASTVDFFNMWAAVLLGLGFSAATAMPRARALVVALVLYAAWAGVFLVGLPSMGGAGR